MSSSLFQRRHYIEIAKMLSSFDDDRTISKFDLTNEFIDIFARDNPNFSKEKFRNAVNQ